MSTLQPYAVKVYDHLAQVLDLIRSFAVEVEHYAIRNAAGPLMLCLGLALFALLALYLLPWVAKEPVEQVWIKDEDMWDPIFGYPPGWEEGKRRVARRVGEGIPSIKDVQLDDDHDDEGDDEDEADSDSDNTELSSDDEMKPLSPKRLSHVQARIIRNQRTAARRQLYDCYVKAEHSSKKISYLKKMNKTLASHKSEATVAAQRAEAKCEALATQVQQLTQENEKLQESCKEKENKWQDDICHISAAMRHKEETDRAQRSAAADMHAKQIEHWKVVCQREYCEKRRLETELKTFNTEFRKLETRRAHDVRSRDQYIDWMQQYIQRLKYDQENLNKQHAEQVKKAELLEDRLGESLDRALRERNEARKENISLAVQFRSVSAKLSKTTEAKGELMEKVEKTDQKLDVAMELLNGYEFADEKWEEDTGEWDILDAGHEECDQESTDLMGEESSSSSSTTTEYAGEDEDEDEGEDGDISDLDLDHQSFHPAADEKSKVLSQKSGENYLTQRDHPSKQPELCDQAAPEAVFCSASQHLDSSEEEWDVIEQPSDECDDEAVDFDDADLISLPDSTTTSENPQDRLKTKDEMRVNVVACARDYEPLQALEQQFRLLRD